jgi:hypothetical protein
MTVPLLVRERDEPLVIVSAVTPDSVPPVIATAFAACVAIVPQPIPVRADAASVPVVPPFARESGRVAVAPAASPRFVRAVEALATSERLFAVLQTSVSAVDKFTHDEPFHFSKREFDEFQRIVFVGREVQVTPSSNIFA